MTRRSNLGRARPRLYKQLAKGWQRAVFVSPQDERGEREEQVVEGPGELADQARFEQAFNQLMEVAEGAANSGLFKQTFVLDERRRIELDARHGRVRTRNLDEAKIVKQMGGKDRPLRPDRSQALLRAIGIMNADGTISARNAKKYKQVNHMVELCRPTWQAILARPGRPPGGPLKILDLACGGSYLSFVLLEALRLIEQPARLLGVDLREDVIETSRARAEKIGFKEDARFEQARIESLESPVVEEHLGGSVDLALSLHACDTATDAALALAIRGGIPAILCVPCCQAELAKALGDGKDRGGIPAIPPTLIQHGLLRRAFGELLTDALRVELLEACGYSVTVLEFVASEHTTKNLMIRAHRRGHGEVDPTRWRLDPVVERCAALGVEPSLLTQLRKARESS